MVIDKEIAIENILYLIWTHCVNAKIKMTKDYSQWKEVYLEAMGKNVPNMIRVLEEAYFVLPESTIANDKEKWKMVKQLKRNLNATGSYLNSGEKCD